MGNGRKVAARVAGVAAAATLIVGVAGPAGAATQDVEYALLTGTVTVGANTYVLPAATGLAGTWDDASGAFDAAFTSEPVATTQGVTSPIVGTIDLTYEFVADGNMTGTIDPATGAGTLDAVYDVVVTLQTLTPEGGTPTVLDQICTIDDVPVTYAVTATGLGASGSPIFIDLALTASGFAAPAATCVAGPAGNPALTPLVQDNFNSSTGLPTQSTASDVSFQAGTPPPPSTTTTTATPPTTPSTTAFVDLDCEDFQYREDAQAKFDADPSDPHRLDEDRGIDDGLACEHLPSRAAAVRANPRFTG